MASNMSLVKMERPCVSQADLANIITIRNQIEKSKRLLIRFEREALEALQRGAEVEPGMNSAELLTEWVDGKLSLQRSVNGTVL